MKTITLSVLFIFLSSGLFAQHFLSGNSSPLTTHDPNKKEISFYPGVYQINQTRWVQDSTYSYSGNSSGNDDWVLSSRYKVLLRDSSGNTIQRIFHFYNSDTRKWKNGYLSTYSYFPDNSLHTELGNPWNSDAQQWDDTMAFFRFDESGVLLLQISMNWDVSNNKFTNGFKSVYNMVADSSFYDINQYSLNMDSAQWGLTFNERHYFDQEAKDTLIYQRVWSSYNSEWINIAKFYNTFDNGQLASTLSMKWDDYLSLWANERNIFYTYSNSGEMVEEFIKLWNSETESWNDSEKYSYFYNNEGTRDSLVLKLWDNDAQLWYYYLRETTTVENNGQRTLTLKQLWDNENRHWNNISLITKINDENGLLTEYTYNTWDSESEQWKGIAKYEFYWSQIEVYGIEEETANKITIYPNPAEQTITISTPVSLTDKNLSIYSVSGRLVTTVTLYKDVNTIDISDIPSGLYFVRFKTTNGLVTKRFVKR